jgi:hypothetical protein
VSKGEIQRELAKMVEWELAKMAELYKAGLASQEPHVHDFFDALHAKEVGNGVIRLTKACQAYDCDHIEWERFIPPEPAPPPVQAGRAMDPEDA